MTIDEYLALGETQTRTELQEGSVVHSPGRSRGHQRALAELECRLAPQLPDSLLSIMAIDVDLELAPAGQPGTSRRPDLIVIGREPPGALGDDSRMVRASEVVLVVELVEEGTKRLDKIVKRDEYAAARIPTYWIVELDKPVSLVECRRTDEFGYVDDGAVTGVFTASRPFEVTIDLDALV
jgi:Uma2 family endonuclease